MEQEPLRRFVGKVVLITGAADSVGAAVARRMTREGATVVLADRNQPALESLAQELRAGGHTVEVVPIDATDPSAMRGLVECTLELVDQLDVVINDAGIDDRGELEQHTPEQLAQIVQKHLGAPIVLSRLVLPHLTETRGSIINVASPVGRLPVAYEAIDETVRSGLRAFSHALTEELTGVGIRVSIVAPSPGDQRILTDEADLGSSRAAGNADQIAQRVVECAARGPERTPSRPGGLGSPERLYATMVRAFSHDVNTPLGVTRTAGSAITDVVRDLVDDPPEDPKELEEMQGDLNEALELLNRNLDRAQHVIVGFRHLALLELSTEERVVKLDELIDERVAAMRSELEAGTIEVRIVRDEGEDYSWYGVPDYLAQVIDELLENAIRHAFAGRESRQITFELQREDAQFVIRCADDGKGVEPSLLPRVFEPMANAEKGGAGLGLATARFIVVKALGGTMECQSETGKHTVFTVELPAVVGAGTGDSGEPRLH